MASRTYATLFLFLFFIRIADPKSKAFVARQSCLLVWLTKFTRAFVGVALRTNVTDCKERHWTSQKAMRGHFVLHVKEEEKKKRKKSTSRKVKKKLPVSTMAYRR